MQSEFGDGLVHFENHLSDPLTTPETTARGAFYGVNGHPHVRIDGLYSQIGATSCQAAATNYRNKINQRLVETGGMSPVDITGSFSLGANEITIESLFRLLDPVDLTDLRATLLVYENNVFYCCGFGGVSIWQRVTRRILDQSIVLENPGDEVSFDAVVPLDPSWNPSELVVIAYLQRVTGNKEIIQGFLVPPQDPAEVESPVVVSSLAGIRDLRPNPARSFVDVEFGVPASSATSPIRLEIYDLLGRRVAMLEDGVLPAGLHSRRWEGMDADGRRLPTGVYFARLQTAEGEAVRRVVLFGS